MWASPLKPKAAPKTSKAPEQQPMITLAPKPKALLSRAAAKRLLSLAAGKEPDTEWVERWLIQLCREHSYPLSWIGPDILSKLTTLLPPEMGLKTLEQLRLDYAAAHPFANSPTDDYSFLEDLPESDTLDR
jgi:hypothetical protein